MPTYMRALRAETIYIYMNYIKEQGKKKEHIVFVRLASMQQPWQSIRVVVIVVRAQVNIQGVSFHSVRNTANHEYIEKR